jgi:hypothetical protein
MFNPVAGVAIRGVIISLDGCGMNMAATLTVVLLFFSLRE